MRVLTRFLAIVAIAAALAGCQWLLPQPGDSSDPTSPAPAATAPAATAPASSAPRSLPVIPSDAPVLTPSIEVPPPID